MDGGAALSVTAVIVTHESAELIDACLDSLEEHAADARLTILVSDSGSTDRIEELCSARGVEFLAGPNHGFGAAVNRALQQESVRGADYVLVMNPDVTIAEGRLADWIADCDVRPECGVFGPRQIDQHGEPVLSIGREPTLALHLNGARTLEPDWVCAPEAYVTETRCDWVMGAFMLVRRELIERLGGFDERFFLFSEEIDLCTRVRRAGLGVVHLPTLTIVHSTADRPFDEYRVRMIMWSQIVYMRKWYGLFTRTVMRTALVVRVSRRFLRNARHRADRSRVAVSLGAAVRFRANLYGPPGAAGEPAE